MNTEKGGLRLFRSEKEEILVDILMLEAWKASTKTEIAVKHKKVIWLYLLANMSMNYHHCLLAQNQKAFDGCECVYVNYLITLHFKVILDGVHMVWERKFECIGACVPPNEFS